ncbi:hypothetical protein FHX59_004780 [Paraburkholderia silvatlantica]|uniref:Uncharacterized protein n=1 Tax=Paraburkholderia silvatlantica TaxID=321895 RepID=A0A2U1ABM3_9BURK|nr:hypothetical protein [Paraburkholderia silvatlantica]PVY32148.1 hypothetical protein C7411_110111 [Paraburkholderia silvatlantica]PXW37768.1 hypothetical protein C7413_110111 [Paraburkholderia silvatlantica]PYE25589.1 hypothetical protein C7410_104169 [Paraburkholderia silvatlantica]TDQ97768.1 hypothetical protein C7412_10796 [Paraburkholderia silvatlantica]
MEPLQNVLDEHALQFTPTDLRTSGNDLQFNNHPGLR